MEHFSDRTKIMLGDGYERLKSSRVAVFGIGGVGGYAVEALARAGVGSLVLVDSDRVSVSNINRQIIATADTVGRYKTEVARERVLSINPECKVETHELFFSAENKDSFNFSSYDFVIDAIDSLSSKIELILAAKAKDTKIISAMGAGNKLDPTRFKVADISKTAVCPLARAVRVELRKRGVNHLKVVFSDEPAVTNVDKPEDNTASGADKSKDTITSNTKTRQKIGKTEPLCSENEAKTTVTPTPCNEKSSEDVSASSEKNITSSSVSGEINENFLTEKEKYDTRRAPGSVSFVPSVMGLILAGEVIKDIALA